jgi:signal transduction histidine kinase
MKNLGIILTTVFLVSLILVYYLGRLFAAKALAPISQVVEQVKDIDISNMSNRVRTVNEKDEIGTLSETFNKMLDRLESSFKIQNDFITNSSHELRTPLTAITGQLEVTLLQERSIEINLKDNGIGIPEHELNLVFQPFYRAENVKKNRGHGIGLSLVDKIITLHNGSIKVVSRLKKGSEFRLKFPLAN